MTKRDYYEVLEVPRSADGPEIKKAYLKLAKKYHPDTNAGFRPQKPVCRLAYNTNWRFVEPKWDLVFFAC